MNRFQFIVDKILTVDEANQKRLLWEFKGYKVVFTNGCFDILLITRVIKPIGTILESAARLLGQSQQSE